MRKKCRANSQPTIPACTKPSKDPDILASMKALRRAAKRALELGRQTGTPVYVLKQGKIVDIAKQEENRGKKRG
jgi:hypothetical protein